MSNSLFDDDDKERPPQAARLGPVLREWAAKGIFFGTSSWKYPGWVGSIYSRHRYLTRNKFSKSKFEANCLTEYAETFPVVGGDFSFYQFPALNTRAKTFADIPPSFGFGLKVPESVTVTRWAAHARYGSKAGQPNEHFLDAALFENAFTLALEPHRDHVAVMIFEFGTLAKRDFATPDDFLKRLAAFLETLPRGWRYAVEIRNREYLTADYFSILTHHNVAHVFNAWTRMPTIAEQIAMPGAFTADFTVVRALLQKGRSYDEAVTLFEPYEKVQQPDPSTRSALRQIAEQCVREKRKACVFVNNRLEGNAPATIEAVASNDGSGA
jgi:uncharacterized protein YecE (DUF72 family)